MAKLKIPNLLNPLSFREGGGTIAPARSIGKHTLKYNTTTPIDQALLKQHLDDYSYLV